MKSGFFAILGKPNAGKSSLMNALIGQKVSIVSPRAQTTRDKVTGILTEDNYQLVFTDTPGIFKPRSRLDEYMEKRINQSTDSVDAIILVLDAQKGVSEKDIALIQKYVALAPLYVALNKEDLCGYQKLYPLLTRLSPLLETPEKKGIKEIIPTSAKTKLNVDTLKNYLLKHCQDPNQYFDEDDLSDKPISFMIAEIIREKTLWLLQDEIPHGIGVIFSGMKDGGSDGETAVIEADIVCEKEGHRQIIIGKDGQMLKNIGQKAREEIEKLLQKKVYLQIYVKVRENWRNRATIMGDLGFKD